MIKLALIGDSALQHYTVADRLWELISVVIDKKIRFTIIPLASAYEVRAVFKEFQKDKAFLGFNIASPWQEVLAVDIDREKLIDFPTINTVYKGNDGMILGVDTSPLAAQRAIGRAPKYKTALVIGADGQALASHLHGNLDVKTYLYEPAVDDFSPQKGVTYLSSLSEIIERHYDLIINATPLGRHYFDKHVEAFTSPLDLETLEAAVHKNTIVQETNYMPSDTLLLQMARHVGLPTVTGDLMLVFEALESLERYFGIVLDDSTVHMLVEEIRAYIDEREVEILEQ